MRMVFRADASKEIGSGHVMRSSVLAEEAVSNGYECVFIGKISGLSWVEKRISSLGFTSILRSEEDYAPSQENDILILDSYTIKLDSQFLARKNWRSIVAIKDPSSPDYYSDVELWPSLHEKVRSSGAKIVLSGPKHLLMRKGIEKVVLHENARGPLRVLVVGGGADQHNFAIAMASILEKYNGNFEVHFFSDQQIHSRLRSTGVFITHPFGDSIDEVSRSIDLVFTTASTASLEFIARGIPTGVACAVENQLDNYLHFGKTGFATQIGEFNSKGEWALEFQVITKLMSDFSMRKGLIDLTRDLIDFDGANRILRVIESL